MIFEFYLWKIEVDVEKTRKYYQMKDMSSDKKINNIVNSGTSDSSLRGCGFRQCLTADYAGIWFRQCAVRRCCDGADFQKGEVS